VQSQRTGSNQERVDKVKGVLPRLFRKDPVGRVENVRITVDRRELRRGEDIVARVEVQDGRRLPDGTSLGLLCEVRHSVCREGGESGSLWEHRDILYEHQEPMNPAQPVQEMRFRVPEDSAYSWEGVVLSFCWRVVMLEPAGKEPNVLTTPFWVTP
jgi:hypothetical protein